MVLKSTCSHRREDGSECRSAPMRELEFCFWHSPDHTEEAAEARRLGGQRRKRERVVAGAYEFAGLDTLEGNRRLLDIAALDTLGLENSIARSRTLAYLVQVSTRLMETQDMEERLELLERSVAPRKRRTQRGTW